MRDDMITRYDMITQSVLFLVHYVLFDKIILINLESAFFLTDSLQFLNYK